MLQLNNYIFQGEYGSIILSKVKRVLAEVEDDEVLFVMPIVLTFIIVGICIAALYLLVDIRRTQLVRLGWCVTLIISWPLVPFFLLLRVVLTRNIIEPEGGVPGAMPVPLQEAVVEQGVALDVLNANAAVDHVAEDDVGQPEQVLEAAVVVEQPSTVAVVAPVVSGGPPGVVGGQGDRFGHPPPAVRNFMNGQLSWQEALSGRQGLADMADLASISSHGPVESGSSDPEEVEDAAEDVVLPPARHTESVGTGRGQLGIGFRRNRPTQPVMPLARSVPATPRRDPIVLGATPRHLRVTPGGLLRRWYGGFENLEFTVPNLPATINEHPAEAQEDHEVEPVDDTQFVDAHEGDGVTHHGVAGAEATLGNIILLKLNISDNNNNFLF